MLSFFLELSFFSRPERKQQGSQFFRLQAGGLGGLAFTLPILSILSECIMTNKTKHKGSNWVVGVVRKERAEQKRYRIERERLEAIQKSGPVIRLDAKTFKPKPVKAKCDPSSDSFLKTYEWRSLRMLALKNHGARCQCCGATAANGVMIHVDHVKPRKTHPHLALALDNLQILCEVCNHGKGNWDTTDWRK